MKKILLVTWMVLVVAGAGVAQQRRMVTEKIEWTYSDRPEKPDDKLPNVLLVGDSITRAYYKATAETLAGKANVYYFATSASVGDERLAPQLAEYFRMIECGSTWCTSTTGCTGGDTRRTSTGSISRNWYRR